MNPGMFIRTKNELNFITSLRMMNSNKFRIPPHI